MKVLLPAHALRALLLWKRCYCQIARAGYNADSGILLSLGFAVSSCNRLPPIARMFLTAVAAAINDAVNISDNGICQ
jgi:hypothetical protein